MEMVAVEEFVQISLYPIGAVNGNFTRYGLFFSQVEEGFCIGDDLCCFEIIIHNTLLFNSKWIRFCTSAVGGLSAYLIFDCNSIKNAALFWCREVDYDCLVPARENIFFTLYGSVAETIRNEFAIDPMDQIATFLNHLFAMISIAGARYFSTVRSLYNPNEEKYHVFFY